MNKTMYLLLIVALSELAILSCRESNPLEVKKVMVDDTTATQSGPLLLLESSYILGNINDGTSDSVLLRFNASVNVLSIRRLHDYCIADIVYTYGDSNRAVTFSDACARLGSVERFDFAVSGDQGLYLRDTIDVPFYERKVEFTGMIASSFLDDGANRYWIATKSPNRLKAFSANDLTQLSDFPLGFTPTKIVVNPYNSLLYVLSSRNQDIYSSFADSIIYVIDPTDGRVVKTVTFSREPDDHPEGPRINAYDLGFTSNGYGIVLLIDQWSSGKRWKIVDSRANDTTSIHHLWGYDIGQYKEFHRVHLNFQKNKLLLMEDYGSCAIDILDGVTHSISQIIPTSITRGVFITPNRRDERIYCGQLYDQFIMTMEGVLSRISYIDNRSDGSADFSYRENEGNIVYFVDGYLRVLDYENALTLMETPTVSGLRNVKTTLDGEHLLACRPLYPTSEIFQFATKTFYRNDVPSKAPGRSSVGVDVKWQVPQGQ